ncbi:SRPBCC family protein [Streptomyces virginiae]|uniref:SRPBCC family protein n=1 Tax=Streptomyces virginiae TaxID=1961 RepID=UPI0035D91CCD
MRTAYDQWTRFESFPHFMDVVERIEQRTDTMTHWVTKVGGVTKEFEAEGAARRPAPDAARSDPGSASTG